MLFTGLCHAFFFIVNLVLPVFPKVNISWLSSAQAGIANAAGVVHRLDTYFPVVTWLVVVGFFATLWATIGVVVAVRKLWSLFTGGGGI